MKTEGIIHNPTYRVISVLNFLAICEEGASMTEIVRATGIPIGTIFPIIQQLTDCEFVQFNGDNNKYSIGLRLFLNGSVFLRSSDSLDSINIILQKLAECSGETTHFAKLDGGNVLYLSKVETKESIRMYSAIGKVIPAYGTGLGKALLSQKSIQELFEIYPDGLCAITKNTITSYEELYNQLIKVRETGYAYEWEESNTGVTCIAKPILKNGKVCSAISVGIPIFRYTEEKKKLVMNLLNDAAQKIEKIVVYLNFI